MSELLARRHSTGVATVDPVSTRWTSSSASDDATRLPYMCASMTCWMSKYGTEDAASVGGHSRATSELVWNRVRAAPVSVTCASSSAPASRDENGAELLAQVTDTG